MPCSMSRRAVGPVLTEGGATLCVWRDKEDIAGLPVPPSGRKERLQGHPSLGAGRHSRHSPAPPVLPASSNHPSHTHHRPGIWPTLFPMLTHPRPSRLYKAPPRRHRPIYSRCSLLITSSTVLSNYWVSIPQVETSSEIHSCI